MALHTGGAGASVQRLSGAQTPAWSPKCSADSGKEDWRVERGVRLTLASSRVAAPASVLYGTLCHGLSSVDTFTMVDGGATPPARQRSRRGPSLRVWLWGLGCGLVIMVILPIQW